MKVELSMIIPMILTVLGLAWTYFGAIINIKERLARIETKTELFWKPLQDYLTQVLHHPNSPSLDRKLENFDSLGIPDLAEMKVELRQKVEELKAIDKSDPSIFFYVLMMARVDQKIEDLHMEMCKPFASIFTKVLRKLLGRS